MSHVTEQTLRHDLIDEVQKVRILKSRLRFAQSVLKDIGLAIEKNEFNSQYWLQVIKDIEPALSDNVNNDNIWEWQLR